MLWPPPHLMHNYTITVELTGEGRACIPVGLTKTWDGLVNCIHNIIYWGFSTRVRGIV